MDLLNLLTHFFHLWGQTYCSGSYSIERKHIQIHHDNLMSTCLSCRSWTWCSFSCTLVHAVKLCCCCISLWCCTLSPALLRCFTGLCQPSPPVHEVITTTMNLNFNISVNCSHYWTFKVEHNAQCLFYNKTNFWKCLILFLFIFILLNLIDSWHIITFKINIGNLHIQQTCSNTNMHSWSCACPLDEGKSNIHSHFSYVFGLHQLQWEICVLCSTPGD